MKAETFDALALRLAEHLVEESLTLMERERRIPDLQELWGHVETLRAREHLPHLSEEQEVALAGAVQARIDEVLQRKVAERAAAGVPAIALPLIPPHWQPAVQQLAGMLLVQGKIGHLPTGQCWALDMKVMDVLGALEYEVAAVPTQGTSVEELHPDGILVCASLTDAGRQYAQTFELQVTDPSKLQAARAARGGAPC